MPFSIWKTITLSLICILVNQPSVISREPDASYFVGQFGGTASELRQNCLGAEQIQVRYRNIYIYILIQYERNYMSTTLYHMSFGLQLQSEMNGK